MEVEQDRASEYQATAEYAKAQDAARRDNMPAPVHAAE
jgi:hypothetical protein